MDNSPSISVILPVYNAGKFVSEAIKSILDQTFADFELLVINDGSIDSSELMIKSFSDHRIVYLNNEGNKGLIYTLNRGIQFARGKYIVRMDADDVCYPNRFQIQFDFMESNPDVAVCGAQMEDYDKMKLISRVETNSLKLKASLLFTCVLSHPTVIMRSEIIKSNDYFYDTAYPHAEDYELWSRIARKFKIANIKNSVLAYRFHDQQVSRVYNDIQVSGMKKCQMEQFQFTGFLASDSELDLHSRISSLNFEKNISFFVDALTWLNKMLNAPQLNEVYSHDALKSVIGDWYFNLTGEFLNAKVPIKKNILFSPLTYKSLSLARMLKLFIKIIVK